ncbi:MAG TPA: SDR family NAD(P)-dependent oxidoreductase [Pyrinomonadaceae bacterium]|nr:SDR family NAD(P)-dependent oxidoreductase [Pyrinomonadaceae bacterium]
MWDFKDRAAVVTGAASGIGRACALELARGGASVAVVDVADEARMEDARRALEEAGGRAVTFRADVSDFAAAGRVVSETLARFGRLDILVNAAGVTADAPLWKMTEAQWERVVSVNLKGTFNYLRAAAPVFRERRAGKVVNVASVEALRGRFGIANYAASKAGVVSLTKSAAAELGRSNVNVNAVAPGFIRTPMTDPLPDEIKEHAARTAALGRLGDAEEVAQLVAFLCSERARFITGEVVKIDGGLLI